MWTGYAMCSLLGLTFALCVFEVYSCCISSTLSFISKEYFITWTDHNVLTGSPGDGNSDLKVADKHALVTYSIVYLGK